MKLTNKQVLLANRPQGWVQESDFRIVEKDLSPIREGEVLVKNHYLSLDPYMRGRMNDARSYAERIELGDVMVGSTVGEIVESKNSSYRVGEQVVGYFGWQQYGVSTGHDLMKVPSSSLPSSVYLGVVGMPGVTAWYGLNTIGQPQAGETVVVSAASGAVGSIVGQLAKLKGCRVVGIAGGKIKCQYVVQELGFDACVDYKAGRLSEDLRAAAPDGIDIDFENVGGEIFEVVLSQLNPHARVPLCGLVSQYNETRPQPLKSFALLLVNRVKLQGFIITDHMQLWPDIINELQQLVVSGKLKYRESITKGLENAPKAFIGMLRGENLGKQLVQLV